MGYKKIILIMVLALSTGLNAGWGEEYKKADHSGESEKACQILQIESDKNNFQAMWFLAVRHETMNSCGEGLQDFKKAFSLYTILADNNKMMGYAGLANMYQKGLYVKEDFTKSLYYREKSAKADRFF